MSRQCVETVYSHINFNNKYGAVSTFTRAWFFRRDEDGFILHYVELINLDNSIHAYVRVVLLAEHQLTADNYLTP